jgi:hypothetical protein
MSKHNRYPALNLRSKNEIAKRISGVQLPYHEALALINDVMRNRDKYWYDSDASEPESEKYVRSAVGTPLGKLLKLIDIKILAPYDKLAPDFIFGGLAKRNHIQAARHLLGKQRRRTLLKLDIRRFFEQIHRPRVFQFFYKKCGCGKRAARILSEICCVPLGPKGAGCVEESIARGFATSPRLALWCNLDLFLRLSWEAKNEFKGRDPRIAIFVDDIGIMVSKTGVDILNKFSERIENLLLNFDPNQPLPINPGKKEIMIYTKGIEHLGLRFGRKKLTMGRKARSRLDKIRAALSEQPSKNERQKLLQAQKAYHIYKRQITKT